MVLGGLLIIFSNNILGSGKFSSTGYGNCTTTRPGVYGFGQGTGGGSINIFVAGEFNKSLMTFDVSSPNLFFDPNVHGGYGSVVCCKVNNGIVIDI